MRSRIIHFRHKSDVFSSTGRQAHNWQKFRPGDNVLDIGALIKTVRLRRSPGIRFWESFNYLNLTETVPDVCHTQSSLLVGK